MARETKRDVEQVLPTGRADALQPGNRCRPENSLRFYEEVARGRFVYRRYSSTVQPLIDSSTRKVILLTRQRRVTIGAKLLAHGDIGFERRDLDG